MSELHITFFYQILKMFLIMALGFLAIKVKLIPSSAGKGVSQLAAFVVKPCAILYAFQVDFTTNKAKGFLLALVASVIVHAIFIALARPVGKLFGFSSVERTSIIYTNSGNLLMPLVAATMGQEWLFYSCAYMAIHQPLVWTHGKSLICGEPQIDWKKALVNVNIISIAAGILLFFANIRFPGVLADTVSSVSSMQGAINMLSIGISFAALSNLNLKKISSLFFVTLNRLILFPAVIMAVFFVLRIHQIMPDAYQIILIVLLGAAAPSAAVVTQIAQIHGKDEAQGSLINVVTMLCSIFTMPALIWIYERLF